MQYFFKKNSSKKENRHKKYIIFRITSHKDINDELILTISRIINANPCIDIFEKNLSFNAIFYRAGINSPWSSKTKDILDSCLSFTSYQIDRFSLVEHDKDKSESSVYDPMTEILLSSNKLISLFISSVDIFFLFIENKSIFSSSFNNIPLSPLHLPTIRLMLD